MGISILLVEDDPILGMSLNQMLNLEGYQSTWAQRFNDAVSLLSDRKFLCCLFDIGLPDGNGIELCRLIREKDSNVPIIFLTAQTDEKTLLSAFENGANDFIKKPFSQKELVARIKAVTRNIVGNDSEIVFGELKLNLAKRELSLGQSAIIFNNTEARVMQFFMTNAERIITRDKLIKFLGKENDIYDRTIDSHISHIRKQLKESNFPKVMIKSIYGVGYQLEYQE